MQVWDFRAFFRNFEDFTYFSTMSALFHLDSDSDASSSNISMPAATPSRTFEALAQKNLFLLPDFTRTPENKIPKSKKESLNTKTLKSPIHTLSSSDSDVDLPDCDSPHLKRVEKRKLFAKAIDGPAKMKMPPHTVKKILTTSGREFLGAGEGSQTIMTPISTVREGTLLSPFLQNSGRNT